MAMKSLQEIRSIFNEPQLLHRWEIQVPTWPTAVQPSNPNILFFVTSSDVPNTAGESTTKVELGGFKLNYNSANNDRNGEIEWTFFENTASDVIKYFFIDYFNKRQNFNSISDISLKSELTSALIAPIVNMNLLASDASTITKQIQLVNVMWTPAAYGGELGQEAAAQKPTVKVEFDSFVLLKV